MKLFLPLVLLAASSCAEPTRFHAFSIGDVVSFANISDVTFVQGEAPSGWAGLDFNDAYWQRGQTRLTRAAAEMQGKLFVRGRFDAGPQAQNITELRVRAVVSGADYDVLINGVTVARESLRGGEVSVPSGTLRPSDNIIALALTPVAGRTLSLGLVVDAVEPLHPRGIVRGPYLQDLRNDGVTVVFDTATEVPGSVVVDGQVFAGPVASHHEIVVSGLAPASRHTYHVEAAGTRSEELELASGPSPGEPVSFVVYGDTRTDGDTQRRLCAAMASEGVDFALATGDLVYESSSEEWKTFFAIEYGFLSRTPLYSAVGNHDNDSRAAELFRRNFALPSEGLFPERVYGFDVGDVHVAVLDSNTDPVPQGAWLDKDLAAARARGAKHLFLLMHHGPYSAGESHGGSGAMRDVIVPVALRHDVDAIFSGHDHIYERGNANGLRYFVSGGGGAPLDGVDPMASTEKAFSERHYLLVSVAGGKVTVQAKGLSDQSLDQVTF